MGLVFFAIVASVPFYYIWNELAPIYFTHLPEIYLHLPFWHCMGLLVLAAIIRVIIFPSATFVNKPRLNWKKD